MSLELATRSLVQISATSISQISTALLTPSTVLACHSSRPHPSLSRPVRAGPTFTCQLHTHAAFAFLRLPL